MANLIGLSLLSLLFPLACYAGGTDPTCTLEPGTGPCKGNFRRYYYDSNSGYCREFTYGGCEGNANNFETKEECEERCGSNNNQGVKSDPNDGETSYGLPKRCLYQPDSGLCYGNMPRYYFDLQSFQCEGFIYGGCGGNGNNFLTKEECEEVCSSRKD